ncbi:MAG: DegT/DnrJ/EryC1/StrS family aminotransferase [Halochromatium sp.]|uniref:DegT/DnrJ/EryC1/StrS family aminotransferase n=2 Tax=Halochromatium sp. TaxID=2049430 RepID=UPI003978CCB0
MALAKCLNEGGRLWLYVGSVQTLEYVLTQELRRAQASAAKPLSAKQQHDRAKTLLKTFAADKQWLAALAGEGSVFDTLDPEDEQLLRCLDRFAPGSIKLLTRDEALLTNHGDRVISPDAYCQQPLVQPATGFVDLKTQQDALRPELERGIHRVLHHGQYILGPEVSELERRLADYTGAKHCITAASGTDALLIGLMALGIGPGDEVITTPFTFVATVEVIALVGATPVFVDIEPTTCNIDARLIEAKLSDHTKAILPVSLYGQPAEMDAINAIAARHGDIPVIEDAAQSFGADYKGRKSGNLSTLGCTSFFPSKPLGGYGDGGAIFTSDAELAQACREIRVHGQSARYIHGRIGIGGRMDSLQCAVVLANLGRFDQDIAQRQAVARRYHQSLADEDEARTKAHSCQASNQSPRGSQSQHANGNPNEPLGACAPLREPYRVLPWPAPDRHSVFAQYSLLVRERDTVQATLKAAGIPTAVHYPMPINQQPAYAHYCCPECTPVAAAVASHIMSLPMHPHLAAAEQARIVDAFKRACREAI